MSNILYAAWAISLLAPVQKATLPLGAPIRVEVEGFAVEARLTPFETVYFELNGKKTPVARGHLVIDVFPPAGLPRKSVYAVSGRLETSGGFSDHEAPHPNQPSVLHAPPDYVASKQPAREPGRRFWNGCTLTHDEGKLSAKETLKTELLVADVFEDRVVFTGETLAPGARQTREGIDVRLCCFDIDPPNVTVGLRRRATKAKLDESAPLSAEILGPDRKPVQWTLETIDGELLKGAETSVQRGDAGPGVEEEQRLATFRLPEGKKPKSLSVVVTRLDGEWRKLPLTFDAVPEKSANPVP